MNVSVLFSVYLKCLDCLRLSEQRQVMGCPQLVVLHEKVPSMEYSEVSQSTNISNILKITNLNLLVLALVSGRWREGSLHNIPNILKNIQPEFAGLDADCREEAERQSTQYFKYSECFLPLE